MPLPEEMAQIVDGHLVIKISVNNLCFAAVRGPYFENAECVEPKITDEAKFANAILDAINEESENGTTLLHKMLDQAAENAVEYGCEGIQMPDDDED